jgi:hypothetical protein
MGSDCMIHDRMYVHVRRMVVVHMAGRLLGLYGTVRTVLFAVIY